jgi:hypothetical protein
MVVYGLHEVIVGLVDLLAAQHLEWWAQLGLVGLGALLILGAAFVRVRLPGGLELALGAMLALQALALHNAAHLTPTPTVAPHAIRGVFAATLIGLAWAGGRSSS